MPKDSENHVQLTVTRKMPHDHNKKQQVRGENRLDMVKEMQMTTNGSAKNFRDHCVDMGVSNVATVDTLRKMKSQVNNKDMPSTDWIQNAHCVMDSQRELIPGQYLNGYVRSFESGEYFKMILQTETQLRALNKIPAKHRLIEVDATGSLVKIDKKQRVFKQILNYVMLVININDLLQPDINITEMACSRHDVFAISEMFNCFRYNYLHLFPSENLIFRLMISDFSWATMHAALHVFNFESMVDYSKRVFSLSKCEIEINDSSRLWLASCASHTMHRFCKSLKKNVNFSDKEHRHFASHCFSLLLNCQTLETARELFTLLIFTFCSKSLSRKCQDAKSVLQEMIATRPHTAAETPKILFKVANVQDVQEECVDQMESFVLITSDDQAEIKRNASTIKAGSPFSKYFLDLENETKLIEQPSNKLIDNLLHNQKFVDFLQENFMPYMFLWTGFVLRGQDFVNQHTTHLTDSSIENFFYARKRMFPEAVAPARYILGTSYITLGQCNNDYNPTVDTSDDSSEATQTEESTRTAVDMWKPKRAKIGTYQAPQITL